jgi:aryl-alcohol dehydrogenase-like predicted oxidoreductase
VARLAQGGGRLVREEKSDRERNIFDTVLAIAKEAGVTAQDVSIAWLLYRAAQSTTGIVPIIGPRTRTQLDANLGALSCSLNAEQFERLNVASAITLGGRAATSLRDQLPRFWVIPWTRFNLYEFP